MSEQDRLEVALMQHLTSAVVEMAAALRVLTELESLFDERTALFYVGVALDLIAAIKSLEHAVDKLKEGAW